MRTATIQARINPKVKAEAQKILNKLNISMSEAISIYLTQVTLHKGIPFDVKIPNALTAATLKKNRSRRRASRGGGASKNFLRNWKGEDSLFQPI